MSLIGSKCKRGDTFSLRVLIGRGLFLFTSFRVSPRITLYSSSILQYLVGAYGNEVTPVPIPNTEVKLIHVDDTWLVTARETKSVPTLYTLSEAEKSFRFNVIRAISSVGRATDS